LFSHARAKNWTDGAGKLYASLVAHARRPEFYARAGVPDSVDGRFDMIVLHVVLVLYRLRAEGDAGRDLAQALFDMFFVDMDRNLREMGVGDLAVGSRVKGMAKAFYGRAAAYEAALTEGDSALADALRRNLYGTASAKPWELAAMSNYVPRAVASLVGQNGAELLAGRLDFPPPPGA